MPNKPNHQPLFSLGQCVMTPGAQEALSDHNISATSLLQRHIIGDWGTLDAPDTKANNNALRNGYRLFSSYPLGEDKNIKIWVITEHDRSATTLLLPSEY